MGWTEDYALEGWYYFYGKNNIDASIPYFIKSVAYTSNPKKFQNWFIWFDLIYALGSTGRCDEINKLNLEKVWSEFEHQERDQIAEMIISASNEFYCGNKTITLDSLTKTEQIFSEKSVYFENYYYTKTILLMEYGDTKGALNLLENRYDFGQSSYYMFIRHPALLPLKDNQRFQKILKKASMD